MLLVIKDMDGSMRLERVTARNASMQGVGTKLGTLRDAHTFSPNRWKVMM